MARNPQLEAAWAKTPLAEKLMFLIEATVELTEEADEIDMGELLRLNGPRPNKPHPSCPMELVRLIRRGNTMRWVAKQCGVSERTVQRWWAGRTTPWPIYMDKIRMLYFKHETSNCEV